MSDWVLRNGIHLVDVPTKNGLSPVGFIYLIEIDGMNYYGSKKFYKQVTKPALKSGIPRKGSERIYKHVLKDRLGQICVSKKAKALARITGQKATRTAYDRWNEESSWKTYCSSSDKVKALVMKGHQPTRTVLRICYELKELSFFENKYIYANIGGENNLNDNCSGNYFIEEILRWVKQ